MNILHTVLFSFLMALKRAFFQWGIISVSLLTLKFDLVGTLKLDASQFKGKKGEFLCLYIRRPCENYFL